ncbi:MAG: AzlC family ABC transporter permease [Spirochaetaceae bacterium]|jgi:4-azaleucine resistance transporter AzlC|nr:AzlC family ABC transporter permease [Spirochaetaceae bacterium]
MKIKKNNLLMQAFKYSFPVLLGYIAIGIAFGLLIVKAGYPWYLGIFMSLIMYAGAGQYLSVGFFAAGNGLFESCLIQFVINARHMAYGITLLKKINAAGYFKPYLIFALTDETFALLSAIDEKNDVYGKTVKEKSAFLFYVSILDHSYWVLGTVIGVFAGIFIPVSFEGVDFALTALFIVLMIEQIRRVKTVLPFVISAAAGIITVIFVPIQLSLLSALAVSLLFVQLFSKERKDCAA